MKQKFTTGGIIKSAGDMFAGKADMHAYATVEVQDRDGDIFEVKGIDLSAHRDDSPCKVFAQHSYRPTTDGEVPIIGIIREFKQVTKKTEAGEVAALGFAFDWAKVDGKLTPLAAKYKKLYDNGILDSFSAGYEWPKSGDCEYKAGMIIVHKSKLIEVSAVTIPSNPHATAMKALKQELGEDFDSDLYLNERLAAMLAEVKDENAALLKSLTQRFDEFEATYVAKSEGAGQTRDTKTPQAETVEALKELKTLIERFK
jgi:hypothetical protein